MPEKKTVDRVYVTVPQEMTRIKGEKYAFVRDGELTTETAIWNTFQLPPRLNVGDLRLGYGTVINNFANVHDDGTVTFPFIADKPVSVQAIRRGDDGKPVRDPEGRPVFDRFDVDPAALRDALDANEYLVIHKAFVRRDIPYTDAQGVERTFNSVSLAPGTKIGDLDLSNAQLSPFKIMHGYRTQEVEVAQLPKGRPVRITLATEEDGRMVHRKENCVEVDPVELVAAVKAQRAEHVAARLADKDASEGQAESTVPELYDHDVEFGPETPTYGHR